MIDSNNEIKKISKDFLEAVRGVMEAKKNKHGHDAVGHEDEDIDNDGDTDKSDEYLHNRRKAIKASMKKEEVENIDEALDAAARYGQHHTAIKELMKSIDHHVRNHKEDALKHKDYRGKKGVHWGHVGDLAQVHSQLADIHDRLAQQGEYKKTMGESVEDYDLDQIDELSKKTLGSYVGKAADDFQKRKPKMGYDGQLKKMQNRKVGVNRALDKMYGEDVELDEAPVDGVAAGSMNNDGHLCATKVFHKEWAEGTPIYSQHAEPDADGNIAWYDVMFEHGIEKMVATDDLEILMSESHERHGKRKMKEDVEAIQELSNKTLSSYTDKAAGERDKFHGDRNKTADAARKYFNRKAGVRKALEKTNEEVEDLEELSTDTLKSYRKKARAQGNAIVDKMKMGGGDWSKDQKDTKTLRKRAAGAQASGKRLVKRGESLKTEEAEQIDELSKKTLGSYINKARSQESLGWYNQGNRSADSKDIRTIVKRNVGIQKAVDKLAKEEVQIDEISAETKASYMKKAGGESLKTEDVELDEARGRPRKNPLPAGQSDEPEPRQHIIQQLQRAKLSMRGGEHVTFKDGTKHHVAGQHAEKILAKYSAMKPAQKEDFQKKIGASHAAFKAEL